MRVATSQGGARGRAPVHGLVLCLGLVLAAACGSPERDAAPDPNRAQTAQGARQEMPAASAVPAAFPLVAPARIVGTTVDAATGARLGGVRVWAGDAEVTSDSQGRFALSVAAGWNGPLLGETQDGRRGRVELRPLAPGPLEVVLRLVRP